VPVERLDDRPMPRQYLDDPVPFDEDPYRMPHLVLARGELRWTSVVVFLRKPTTWELLRYLPTALLGR